MRLARPQRDKSLVVGVDIAYNRRPQDKDKGANLNKNSYRYLVPLIFGTLLSASLLVTWHSHIYSRTFFKPDLQQSYLIASSVLAIITSLGMLLFKSNIIPGNTLKNIKIIICTPIAALIVCMLILVIPFSLSIYLSTGTQSSYTTAYKKTSGGRRSCSGIEFFEPELNKEIKICRSNVIDNTGQVSVYKTSTHNGIVIIGTKI